MDTKPKSTDFDSTGDLILIVGTGEHTQRFRVSSAILRKASNVFNAMLGPNFIEGQGLGSANNPKEVVLSDDDQQAMRIICASLHFKMGMVPKILIGKELLKIAQTINKYFLQEAMTFQTDRWLTSEKREMSLEDMGSKLKAAILLDNMMELRKAQRALVLDYTACYQIVFGSAMTGGVTVFAAGMMKKREELRNTIIQALHGLIRENMSAGSCSCNMDFATRLMRQLPSDELEPLHIATQPLSSSLAHLSKVKFADSHSRSKTCVYDSNSCLRRTITFAKRFTDTVESVHLWDGSIDLEP